MVLLFLHKMLNQAAFFMNIDVYVPHFQWTFDSGSGTVNYRPSGGLDNVNMIAIQFTPLAGVDCFEVFDLVIEACCEFGECIFIPCKF